MNEKLPRPTRALQKKFPKVWKSFQELGKECYSAGPRDERVEDSPHGVYASPEAHMSVSKAVSLLGIGPDNLRLIPVDDRFRMLPAALEQSMRRDEELGITPLAVVATAGTENTGAIDPLAEIAEIAGKHRGWLHVDGSYGALAAMAIPDKFPGLARADSIALDPRKWLYQPLDCGFLLHRNTQTARAAFADSGD